MLKELKELESVETTTAHISLLDDNIIRLAVKDHAHLMCENLEENYHAYHKMLKSRQ